ncbi:hypothetical protein KFU94_17025 [Chloroflexi bacterium TSY]|nr:hypothetical protein [Chloroflexi bacterium TSY]
MFRKASRKKKSIVGFEWQVGEDHNRDKGRLSVRDGYIEQDGRFFALYKRFDKRRWLAQIGRSTMLLLVGLLMATGAAPSFAQIERRQIVSEINALERRKEQADAIGDPLRRHRPISESGLLNRRRRWRDYWTLDLDNWQRSDREVQSVSRIGDLIRVRMLIHEPTGESMDGWWLPVPFRATFFYQETNAGLQSAVPQADYWGATQQLKTQHLLLNYHQSDAELVTTIAPQLDDALVDLHGILGGNSSDLEKQLTISWQPEIVNQWLPGENRIELTSPALLKIPNQLTDQAYVQQIVQSWMTLCVVDHVLTRTLEEQRSVSIGPQWELGLWGLRSWLRRELNQEFNSSQDIENTLHLQLDASLWRLLQDGAGLEPSSVSNWRDELFADRERFLTQLLVQESIVGYIVASYGRERLPDVLKGFAEYDSWTTLGQGLFGDSSKVFVEGWSDYTLIGEREFTKD